MLNAMNGRGATARRAPNGRLLPAAALLCVALALLAFLAYAAVNGSVVVSSPSDDDVLSGTAEINLTFDGNVNVTLNLFNGTHVAELNTSTNVNVSYGYAFDTTAHPDAYQAYTLSVLVVNATNASDNETVNVTGLSIDNDVPTVTINAPAMGPQDGLAALVINVTYNESGTNVTGCTWTILNSSGDALTSDDAMDLAGLQDGEANATIPAANVTGGAGHVLNVTCTDDTGNEGSASVTFGYDATYPSVALDALDLVSGIVVISGSATDAVLSLTNWSVDAINETGTFRLCNATTPVVGAPFCAWDTSAYADGLYNITLAALDIAGHENTTTLVNVTVDNTYPAAEIDSPTPPVTGAIDVNGTASDANLANFTVSWWNSTGGTGTVCTNASGEDIVAARLCEWDPSALPDGVYNLSLIVYDSAGQMNSSMTSNFMVDNDAPVVTVTSPSDGTNVSGSLTINVTVVTGAGTPVSAVTITNGTGGDPIAMTNTSDIAASSSNWTVTIDTADLADGEQLFAVNATDIAGNSDATESLNVTVDNSGPSAVMDALGVPFVRGSVNVTGYANGTTFVSYTVTISNASADVLATSTSTAAANGTLFEWNSANGTFADGVYSVGLIVFDSLGRNDSDNYTVSVDNTPLSFDYAEDGLGNEEANVSIGSSLLVPYELALFVNMTDNTDVTLQLTHGGVCFGFADPQPIAWNGDDFNTTCWVDKSVLAGTDADDGAVNLTVTANDTREANSTNFTIRWDFERPAVTFSWWNTTAWNQTTLTSSPLTLMDYRDLLANADIFFSPDDTTINFSLNVTDNLGVATVQANLSPIGLGTCDGLLALTLDVGTGLYNGSCDLGVFDEANITALTGGETVLSPYGGIGFVIVDTYGNEMPSLYNASDGSGTNPCAEGAGPTTDCLPLNVPVVIHDIGAPEMIDEECIRFGSLTTDLNLVADMNAVNLVLEIEINLSCDENDTTLPSDFLSMALFNFTSIDLSSPSMGQKLAGLPDQVDVSFVAPQSFGDARIYVNSTYFAELNTTTNVTLSHLPFLEQPTITGDAGAAGGITVEDWSTAADANFSGLITGTLIFSVDGFSGYNVTDAALPTIAITSPEEGSLTNGTDVVVNVTVNATGSGVSQVLLYGDDSLIGQYNNVTGINTANCTIQDAEGETVVCYLVWSAATDGNVTLNVTAYDYGGDAPGNGNTTSIWVLLDESAPVATANATNQTSVDVGDTVLISSSWSDTSWNASNNFTCTLSVDGVANETVDSTGTGCNFTYTTSIADYPSLVFSVAATDIFGYAGSTENMTVEVNLTCGMSVTSNFTLQDDFTCAGNALVIGADDVAVDCDGFTLTGDGTGVAIDADGRAGVSVDGCAIDGFATGISAIGGTLALGDVDVTDTPVAIVSDDAAWSLAARNTFTESNITLNGSIAFGASGVLELSGSHLTWNGTFMNVTGNLTSLELVAEEVAVNTSSDFNFTDAESNVTLYLNASTNVSLVVAAKQPVTTPSATYVALKGIDIQVDPTTRGNLVWSLVRMHYATAELDALDLDESTLRIHYYDEGLGTWVLEGTQTRDAAANYVEANTTHFSLFGLFGVENEEEETPNTGGGGGGGGGAAPERDQLSSTPIRKTISVGGAYSFLHDGKLYSVRIKEMKETSVVFEVNGVAVELAEGASANVDFTKDGTNDMTMDLVSFTAYSATFRVWSYGLPSAPVPVAPTVSDSSDAAAGESETGGILPDTADEDSQVSPESDGTEEAATAPRGSAAWVWILVVLVLLFGLLFWWAVKTDRISFD